MGLIAYALLTAPNYFDAARLREEETHLDSSNSFYLWDGWSSDGLWGDERKQEDFYWENFAIQYIGRGRNSSQFAYWCLKSFVVDRLPETHPFWMCNKLPHPLDSSTLKTLGTGDNAQQHLDEVLAPNSTLSISTDDGNTGSVQWEPFGVHLDFVEIILPDCRAENVPALVSTWKTRKAMDLRVEATLISAMKHWPAWHFRVYRVI
ncbi:hypothetical protein QBC33DRAFT_623656 [Phialemonium atrogriseum]|uniref:DUF2264 domain-containing protein n=1 Tax=Phialemonium atrogriseum TaxID=1093897 RepID=A0AAJ0FHQ9_9PEZI|nr:uncharacterized protein QBC33DRAFT_623656 [Phialemonium atrogriseum]KAK1762434.1 hypothetical protein QBC33DRAFT_623656 [Phialemonium atrogriseum]